MIIKIYASSILSLDKKGIFNRMKCTKLYAIIQLNNGYFNKKLCKNRSAEPMSAREKGALNPKTD